MPSHEAQTGPTPADLADLALPARASPARIALGPWRNEQTFWIELVEKRRLCHLGYPMGTSSLRDALALGPAVFSGRPLPTTFRLVPFIESRIETYLESEAIQRVYFDVTGMKELTGEHGDGYFAFFELDLVLRNETVLKQTRFFEDGMQIRLKGGEPGWLPPRFIRDVTGAPHDQPSEPGPPA